MASDSNTPEEEKELDSNIIEPKTKHPSLEQNSINIDSVHPQLKKFSISGYPTRYNSLDDSDSEEEDEVTLTEPANVTDDADDRTEEADDVDLLPDQSDDSTEPAEATPAVITPLPPQLEPTFEPNDQEPLQYLLNQPPKLKKNYYLLFFSTPSETWEKIKITSYSRAQCL